MKILCHFLYLKVCGNILGTVRLKFTQYSLAVCEPAQLSKSCLTDQNLNTLTMSVKSKKFLKDFPKLCPYTFYQAQDN